MARGLFDRLEAGQRSIETSRSILAHLSALLNTRSIIDLTDLVHTLPDGMRSVERTISSSIERYEPRLIHVLVTHVPTGDPLRLEFRVEGRLAHDPQRALRVNTWVRLPGRFCID